MTTKKIENQEEFISFARQYCYVVDLELSKFEDLTRTDCATACKHLPKLLSLVEVVGLLRGQDGAFFGTEIEAKRSGLSSELYQNEDHFNSRLSALIATINLDVACAKLSSDYISSHFKRFIKE